MNQSVVKEPRRNKSVPLTVVDEVLRQRHVQFTAIDCTAIGENSGAHSDPKKKQCVNCNDASRNQQGLGSIPEADSLTNCWSRALDAINTMRTHINLRKALVTCWPVASCAVTTRRSIRVSGAVFENRWGKRHQRGAASAAARFARYQSTVAFNPSRKFIAAFQPSNCSARVASMRRRGCPSGFVASH